MDRDVMDLCHTFPQEMANQASFFMPCDRCVGNFWMSVIAGLNRVLHSPDKLCTIVSLIARQA
jgi:hypothetical protein